MRNVWAAKKSTLSRGDWEFSLVNLLKGREPCQMPLSCLRCSEEAGPKWHHLQLWLQPLPVCLRLWLLLPLRWPLLLPRRHPAGSAADPPPRRPHPSALLPWRQLPVHRRAQGEHTNTHTRQHAERRPEGNNAASFEWSHTHQRQDLRVRQVTVLCCIGKSVYTSIIDTSG